MGQACHNTHVPLPSEADALRTTRRLLSEWTGVPENRLAPSRLPKALEHADLVARVKGTTLVVQCKGVAEDAIVRQAIEQAKALASAVAGAYPVVAVPFMGALGRTLCAQAGVSWLDLSGNARIVVPNIVVNVEGKPNQFKRPGRPKSLFAPKSARIARWFLSNPSRTISQRELSRTARLDEGFASRVIRRYVEDGYLSRTDAGLKLAQPNPLLDAWRDAYDFTGHTIVRGHIAARSAEELLDQTAKKLHKLKASHAATGLGAAWLLARFAGFRLVTFYVAERPAESLLRDLGCAQEERGANTWLVVPNDEGVFDQAKVVGGVRCVHPVQVYLDLKAHPERAADAAADLRSRLLRWNA
jgi:hypothetical protein